MEQKKGKNICRPITFINDYMPIKERSKEKIEFCAFGIVDGIRVGDALVFDEAKSSITDQIWEDQKIFKRSLEGKYNAQRIYIVRWEEEEVERAFWEGNSLPFFFFCRVQCAGDKLSFMQYRSEWEMNTTASCQSGEVAIKTYLTYDNTDLFIVVRSSKYKEGAEVINRLHREGGFAVEEGCKCTLKNSFTVMAVRYAWIDKVTTSEIEKWNQDVIENVYIRLIEREGGDIGKIEKVIKEKIPNCRRRAVLGTDDEMIVLSDVKWGDFLSLYNEENGIFGNRFGRDSVYNQNAAGVITQLSVPLYNEEKNNHVVPEGNDHFESKIKGLEDKLNKINERFHNINELNIIVNALPKYSGEMFNDYVFFPLLKVLDTLFDLMLRRTELCSGRLHKAPFYDFLTGFCFYTQHTMLTDRHTAQIMGFNVKIYDIPVKLNALYNALLYRLVDILKKQNNENNQNENEIDYDFIALPGVADFVNVVELYKDASYQKRLMKVEIPESSFYDVRNMMTILSHEAAHYVGRGMRNRNARTDAVILSYVHVYVEYIERTRLLTGYKGELWEENKARLVNMIYRAIYRKLQEKKQELGENYKDDIDYFMKLLPQIYNVMAEIIGSDLSTVFAPIIWEEKEEVKKQEILNKIQEASWKFLVRPSGCEVTEVSSMGVLDALMYLYEEGFADLMSILILQMGVEEYIAGIVKNAECQGMDVMLLKETEVSLRISAVLGCILGFDTSADDNSKRKLLFDSRMRNEWRRELEEAGEVKYDDMAPWQKMAQKALWLWARKRHPEYQDKEYEDNIYSAFIYDDSVLKYATGYLKLCMEKFVENCMEEEFREKAEKIRNLFQQFMKKEGRSGEDQIRMVVQFIEDYRRDLLQM